MLGLPPPRDATVVAKLRAAGAIIIGKTNLEEWAGARYSDTRVNGWSGYGGQVVGAYAKYHDPLGSSSGSGVAVSIGLAMAALGTEVSSFSFAIWYILTCCRLWVVSYSQVLRTI